MPDPISEFLLSDEHDEVDGGFNDPMSEEELQALQPEEPEELKEPEQKKAEQEPPVEDEPGDKPDDDSEFEEPEPEQPPEPEYVTQLRQNLALQQQNNAALAQRFNELSNNFQNFQQQHQEKPVEVQPPPLPTDDDFAEDPVRAAEMIVEHKQHLFRQQMLKEQAERDAAVKAEQAEREAQYKLSQATQQSWDAAVQLIPELNVEGSEARDLFAKIYHNPENNLAKIPNGPILAATAVNTYLAPKKTKSAEQAGIKQEQSRQARVKAGAMHGSGKTGGQSKVKGLNRDQAAAAKVLGISPEAYQESLTELGMA